MKTMGGIEKPSSKLMLLDKPPLTHSLLGLCIHTKELAKLGLECDASASDSWPTKELFLMFARLNPCSWSSCSIIQVESLTRCLFHLTKYSKYSLFMVLLATLLSKTLSISNGFTLGNYYLHLFVCSWIFSGSFVLSPL